ncbi:MAG: SIMPL domain-containing protein, partial [Bacteroidota bacterium]
TFAQLDVSEHTPYIEVTGTAEKEVVPDQIFISIKLTDKVRRKENYSILQQEQRLFEIVKNLGLDPNNLYLADAISEVNKKRQREKGVKITKDYVLIAKDANEVNKIYDALFEKDIKDANVFKTASSKIVKIRKEVRIQAIKAAKEKADYLLSAIGESVGKPLKIIEMSEQDWRPRNASSNFIVRDEYKSENDFFFNTSFQKIKVKFSYNVKFSIN